jgi:hypothetical protein
MNGIEMGSWPLGQVWSRERRGPPTAGPALEAEAQASYALRSAMESGNRRWIADARTRWTWAREWARRVLDESAV